MTTKKLSRDELSLLLFLETCAVDKCGAVDGRHMNKKDFETARKWNQQCFLEFGRVLSNHTRIDRTHWCRLLGRSMEAAHHERAARAERMWAKRPYSTTRGGQP